MGAVKKGKCKGQGTDTAEDVEEERAKIVVLKNKYI